MDIQQSRDYIIHKTHWIIDESTFFVLDKERCAWIASVTTSHNHKQGEKEVSFGILVRDTEHFVIESNWCPDLACWFHRKGSDHA